MPYEVITNKSPDFVIISGPNKGKNVDAIYTTDRLTQKDICRIRINIYDK
ncbi:hypothetical protein [Gilliamella apicola]